MRVPKLSIQGKNGGAYPVGWLDPAGAASQAYIFEVIKEVLEFGVDERLVGEFPVPQAHHAILSGDDDFVEGGVDGDRAEALVRDFQQVGQFGIPDVPYRGPGQVSEPDPRLVKRGQLIRQRRAAQQRCKRHSFHVIRSRVPDQVQEGGREINRSHHFRNGLRLATAWIGDHQQLACTGAQDQPAPAQAHAAVRLFQQQLVAGRCRQHPGAGPQRHVGAAAHGGAQGAGREGRRAAHEDAVVELGDVDAEGAREERGDRAGDGGRLVECVAGEQAAASHPGRGELQMAILVEMMRRVQSAAVETEAAGCSGALPLEAS